MIDQNIDPDVFFMREAIKEALQAKHDGEVPIGAVAVKGGEIIARGHNCRRRLHDLTAHAEMMALRDFSVRARTFDLSGITIYSTLEPCAMCAGAMLHYGIHRVVWGAKDLKLGAVESRFHVLDGTDLKSRGGVLADECRNLLLEFFQQELGHPSNTWEDVAV
jgi:tRNA(adenine34) deaminase